MNPKKKQRPGCFLNSCLGVIGGVTGFIALSLAAVVALYFLLWGMGAYLVVSDTLRPVEAVVVLSGGGLTRRQDGIQYYKDQFAKHYVLTETGETVPELGLDYSKVLKVEAMNMGIPEDAILITEEHATNTLEEARAVRKLLEKSEIKSCIVITDPFHTRRARLIFRDAFRGSGMVMRVIPVRGHWYRSNTWWMSERGREATLKEYVKLIAYVAGVQNNQ